MTTQTYLCPNNVIRTHLVSFPRSGHHLMVRGLTEALNNRLVYSEFYTCKHNFSNCPYVNLQKSHDFNDSPIDPDGNYIVMIREFEPAVESWWKTDLTLPFEEFRIKQKQYYDRFVSKWVDGDIPARLLIRYEDFINLKMDYVIQATRHMGVEPNMEKLADWSHREREKPLIHAFK